MDTWIVADPEHLGEVRACAARAYPNLTDSWVRGVLTNFPFKRYAACVKILLDEDSSRKLVLHCEQKATTWYLVQAAFIRHRSAAFGYYLEHG